MKVFRLDGLYVSFYLILGKMPLPRLVVIEQIQNGKEGLY